MKFTGLYVRSDVLLICFALFSIVFPGAGSARMVCDQQPGQPRSCGDVPDEPSNAPRYYSRQPSGPSQEEIEEQQKQAQYNQFYDREIAAQNGEDYQNALSFALLRQQLIDGPNVRKKIIWLNSMIAWKKARELNEEGQIASDAGDFSRAADFFARALRLLPNDAALAKNLKIARAMLEAQFVAAARAPQAQIAN